MRMILSLGALSVAAALSGCSTTDQYANACERDYARNRDQATAAGAVIGGALGAAIDDRNDARGAAIGAAVGGLAGNQLARKDDPCGYGYGGYAYNDRYDRDGYYGRTDGYYDRNGRWHRR
jgi:uncharacterized protein YcfJ